MKTFLPNVFQCVRGVTFKTPIRPSALAKVSGDFETHVPSILLSPYTSKRNRGYSILQLLKNKSQKHLL